MNPPAGRSVSIMRLIRVPALLTLAVTLLRLTGELMDWSPLLFSRAVGGGAAVVGIIWLVPVFGAYFALKLARAGPAPSRAGRVLAFSLVGLAAFASLLALGFAQPTASLRQFVTIGAAAAVGILIAHRGWPSLSAALLAYGLSARIPVALVVLVAVLNDWGTHYDVPPPGLPPLSPLAKWVAIGLIPQLTIWMGVTVILGSISGGLALAATGRLAGRRAPHPTAG